MEVICKSRWRGEGFDGCDDKGCGEEASDEASIHHLGRLCWIRWKAFAKMDAMVHGSERGLPIAEEHKTYLDIKMSINEIT